MGRCHFKTRLRGLNGYRSCMTMTAEVRAEQLAELVKQVQAGNEVLLTQGNKPVAKLIATSTGNSAAATLNFQSFKGHRILTPIIRQEELADEMLSPECLDCNILVQLAFADHPLNPQTTAKVRAEAAAGEKLVFPPLVATEFLHVVTDPRRFAPPLSMTEASDWLNEFIANPSVALIHSTGETLTDTLALLRRHHLGRKRILDTHLAAILQTNGVPRLLTSNPGDFTIFSGLEVISP